MLKKILKITLASLLSFNAYAQIPSNGLVAHYPFDGNTNDVSGNGYHLTVNGSVSYDNSNTSVSIDAGNYLVNPNTAIMPTGSYTIAYWVKVPVLTATYPTILELNEGIYCRYFKSSSNAQLGGYFSSTQNYNHDFALLKPKSEWNHFVITVDVVSGTSYTFLNGVHIGTKVSINYNSSIVKNTGLIIGGGTNSGAINAQKYLAGQVDDVLIYNRALSSSEVGTIYSSKTPLATIPNPVFVSSYFNFTNISNPASGTLNYEVNWQGTTPATLAVQFSTTKSFVNPQTINLTNLTGSRSQNINGFTAGLTYFYRVIATNSAGGQTISPVGFSAASSNNPAAINFVATPLSSTSAKIDFDFSFFRKPADFNIQYSTRSDFIVAPAPLFRVSTIPENGFVSVIVTGLNPSTTYYYRLSWEGNYYVTPEPNIGFSTFGTNPLVNNLRATTTASSASVSYDVIKNSSNEALFTNIEYATSADRLELFSSSTPSIVDGVASTLGEEVKLRTQLIDQLQANTTYYYRVRLRYSPNIVVYSSIASFTTGIFTGFSEAEEQIINIVYPNPASSEINTSEFVEILDLTGNKVGEGEGRIDVSSLNSGIYFLKSTSGTVKFIKE